MKKFCVIGEFITGDTTRTWFEFEGEAINHAGDLVTSGKSKSKRYVVEIKRVIEPQSQYTIRAPMDYNSP